jgi:hypothetical protein
MQQRQVTARVTDLLTIRYANLFFPEMGNRPGWQGMISLCRFKKHMAVMQVGTTCENIEKATLKSNHSRMCSTMFMLGISELTGHCQHRQCQVAEQLEVIHRRQHVLSVMEYG